MFRWNVQLANSAQKALKKIVQETQKMEATCSFEPLVTTYKVTCRHIAEHQKSHSDRRKNLTSQIWVFVFSFL
jgi:hypothetical protein